MRVETEKGKPRLFVDIDGTLAVFRSFSFEVSSSEDARAETIEEQLNAVLYSPGYFRDLPVHESVAGAVKELVKRGHFDVYVLTSCLPDRGGVSPRADKSAWLDKYVPEVDDAHRIYVRDGDPKAGAVPGGVGESDILLDDFTENLKEWESAGGTGVKLLNAVNSSKKTWKGSAVSYEESPESIAASLEAVSKESRRVNHPEPRKAREKVPAKNYEPPVPKRYSFAEAVGKTAKELAEMVLSGEASEDLAKFALKAVESEATLPGIETTATSRDLEALRAAQERGGERCLE